MWTRLIVSVEGEHEVVGRDPDHDVRLDPAGTARRALDGLSTGAGMVLHFDVDPDMPGPTTLTVRIGPELSSFVAQNVGETGTYENVSEYIRDLIRRDRERVDEENFQRLKAELKMAFAAPRENYHPLTLDDILNSPRPSE